MWLVYNIILVPLDEQPFLLSIEQQWFVGGGG